MVPLQPQSPQPIPPRYPMQMVDTKIKYDPVNFRDVYLDEYTREPLPNLLVHEATKAELNYFNPKVWALADAKKVYDKADAKTISTG